MQNYSGEKNYNKLRRSCGFIGWQSRLSMVAEYCVHNVVALEMRSSFERCESYSQGTPMKGCTATAPLDGIGSDTGTTV